MDTAQCLLKDSDLPKTFWSFAVDHAIYLRNRSYHKRMRKTAYTFFTGTPPNITKIYNFESQCTFYSERNKLKLSDHEQSGIYLGVNTKAQGYLLFTPNQKIATSRNFIPQKYRNDALNVMPQGHAQGSRNGTQNTMPQEYA